MILRLRLPWHLLNAQTPKRLTKPRKGASLESAGEIIRRVRKKSRGFESQEEIEILAFDTLGGSAGGSLREGTMRDAEGACVTAQARQTLDHSGIGAARQQYGQQRIVPSARLIDLVTTRCGARLHIGSAGLGAPGFLKLPHGLDLSGDPGSFAKRYRATTTIVNGDK